MKKILMGTTAIIALATFSSQAAAAEKISLGLGGFQKAFAAKVSRAETNSQTMKAAAWTDTEVHVKGSTTLDNGVTISTRIEFEADGSAGHHGHSLATADGATTAKTAFGNSSATDESSMTISSDAMGALTIGATTGAADKMHVGAPAIGPIGWGDVAGLDSNSTSSPMATPRFGLKANEVGDFGDKSVKAVYMSPDFNGVTVGMSYTPGEGFGGQSSGKAVGHMASNDGFQASLGYSGEMSGAAVDVSLSHFNNNAAGINTNAIGVNVGMSGITVGGSYHDFSDKGTITAAGDSKDGNGYDLGVAYESGAMSVAATYMKSENKGVGTTAGKNKDTYWNLGVGYDLGAGVGLVAQYYSAKATAEGATGNSSKGVVAGIEVSF